MKRLLLLLSISQVQLQASFTLHLQDGAHVTINQDFVDQSSFLKVMIQDLNIQPNIPEEPLPVINQYITSQTIETLQNFIGADEDDLKQIAQEMPQEHLSKTAIAADFLGFNYLEEIDSEYLVSDLTEVLAEKLLTEPILPEATSHFEELHNINGNPTVDLLKNTSVRERIVNMIIKQQGPKIFSNPEQAIDCAKFSPNGSQILTIEKSNAALCDVTTGELLRDLRGHKSFINSAEFSPDGNRIITTSWDQTFKLWDAATGQILTSFNSLGGGQAANEMPSSVNYSHFSNDATKIVAACDDGSISTFNPINGERLMRVVTHIKQVNSARFNPDNTRIITASDDDFTKVLNANTGETLFTLNHGSPVNFADFSSDGEKIATACKNGNVATLTSACEVLWVIKAHTSPVNRIQFNSDGTMIVSASEGGSVRLWNTSTGNPLFSIGYDHPVKFAYFNPMTKNQIITTSDSTAYIFAPLTDEIAAMQKWDVFSTPLAQVVGWTKTGITHQGPLIDAEPVEAPIAQLEQLVLPNFAAAL